MASDASTGDSAGLLMGEARKRALSILAEGGHLAPSPDAAAIAYAVLALADAINDLAGDVDATGRHVGVAIEQAANSLDASITDMGRELGRHVGE